MSNDDEICDLMVAFDIGFDCSPIREAGAEIVDEGNSYRLIRKGDALFRVVVERAIPSNVHLSKDQASPPATKVHPEGEELYRFSAPELTGIPTQIQHPSKSGKPITRDPGMIGGSIIMSEMAESGPHFLIQMQHPDGTSLGAIMFQDEYIAFGEIYIELGRHANLVAATKGQSPS